MKLFLQEWSHTSKQFHLFLSKGTQKRRKSKDLYLVLTPFFCINHYTFQRPMAKDRQNQFSIPYKLLQFIAHSLRQWYQERILVLPDDTVLYSGHSEPTTVYAEKSRISQAFPRK